MTLFSFFELWGQGWYLWVTFGDRVSTTGCFLSLTSFPLGTAFMSKIISASLLSLQPYSSCSFSAQEKGLGVESQKALLGSSGQSFPALWVSTEWAATVILRFYCFHFIFFSTPPPCQLLKKHGRVAGCLVNGLFSCWVEQYCCHMLKATISPRRCMSKAAAIPFPCWQM